MAVEEFVTGSASVRDDRLTPTAVHAIKTARAEIAARPVVKFDPFMWLCLLAATRKGAARVLIGDVVRNPATGRRFVVQSVGPAVVLRERGTGQSVKTRTLRGLVPEVEARKRESFTRFAGGRPELYEMVFAWSAAEHDARLLIFCDFLQDGGWGDEWAGWAEGIRSVIEQDIARARR